MAIIALEGMEFFAFHGYYAEEQLLGNDFVLDLWVQADAEKAAETDELYEEPEDEEGEGSANTVNYETLYLLCQVEMKKPTKLLEALVERMADRIEEYFDDISGLLIRLRKLHPPLGGRVDSAAVIASRGNLDVSYLELVKKLK
jgi:7,8-dihydroneopterin aldolase/epimerase/oxygenase